MRALLDLAYLLAAVCFIFGLKRMSSPKTARSGNGLSAVGMAIAIVATLCEEGIVEYWQIIVGALIGGVIGTVMAKRVQMTSMPQLVAVLHGFGSAAAGLVAAAELLRELDRGHVPTEQNVTIQLTAILSSLTVAGSFVAYGKLEEKISGKALDWPFRNPLNAVFLLGLLAIAGCLVADPSQVWLFVLLNLGAALLGVLLVLSIGGADMPVVISVLNSYAGIAGAMAGFVIKNNALIITGALVGTSGMILSKIMCKAMNRSLANVLFGGTFGGAAAAVGGPAQAKGTIKSTSVEDAALLLCYANNVVVVPGYGLAVAQAQHQVRELADLLEKRGVDVKYAIHPVAGRMPGHMNVLLAEANVPYEKLWEMDRINGELDRTDVALVIGANDVVNPAARHDTASPIYGMPILDVDKAKHVIVMKRSMNPGFAGIENELFFDPKTQMLFGDAKASLTKLVEEAKAVE